MELNPIQIIILLGLLKKSKEKKIWTAPLLIEVENLIHYFESELKTLNRVNNIIDKL